MRPRARALAASLAAIILAEVLALAIHTTRTHEDEPMSYSATVLADSPVAYWRLGEAASPGPVADASGNGHAGAVHVTPTFGVAGLLTGDSDTAMAVAGDESGVTVPGSADFAMGAGDFTVEAWIKTGVPGPVVYWSAGADWVGVSGHVASLGGAIPGTTPIDDGARHHVVVTRRSGIVRIYVDGALDMTPAAYGASIGASSAAAIGYFSATSGYSFPGTVDEVAIYKGVGLSDARVAAHYSAGTAGGGPPAVIPTTDANWSFSPYNWATVGGTRVTVNGGAYFKVGFTGTSVALGMDVSSLVAASVPAKQYPRLRWSIDLGAYHDHQLASGDASIALATGLADATHSLLVHVLSDDAYLDRWTTPASAVTVTMLTVDAGKSSAAPTLRPRNMLFYGDSITEAAWCLGYPSDVTDYSDDQDASNSYASVIAQAFDAEYGICAFGGTGWEAGFGNVPRFLDSWTLYYAGYSRLTGGLLLPAPDYIVVNEGHNSFPADAATVVAWLTAARAAAGPSCKIVILVPFSGAARTVLTPGVADYQAAHPGDPCYLVDLSSPAAPVLGLGMSVGFAADGTHPDILWHGRLGAMVARAMQQAIGSYAAASNVRSGTDRGDGTTGTLVVPAASHVTIGTTFDNGTAGTATLPPVADVEAGVTFGASLGSTGTFAVPAQSDVRSGTHYGGGGSEFTGSLSVPTPTPTPTRRPDPYRGQVRDPS